MIQINRRPTTYIVFGYRHVGDAADDCDEVEYVPRVAKIIL